MLWKLHSVIFIWPYLYRFSLLCGLCIFSCKILLYLFTYCDTSIYYFYTLQSFCSLICYPGIYIYVYYIISNQAETTQRLLDPLRKNIIPNAC
jgi:hypothetical protein